MILNGQLTIHIDTGFVSHLRPDEISPEIASVFLLQDLLHAVSNFCFRSAGDIDAFRATSRRGNHPWRQCAAGSSCFYCPRLNERAYGHILHGIVQQEGEHTEEHQVDGHRKNGIDAVRAILARVFDTGEQEAREAEQDNEIELEIRFHDLETDQQEECQEGNAEDQA